jgi:ERCC4-related helicase/dsRNA-specific ribonuclease
MASAHTSETAIDEPAQIEDRRNALASVQQVAPPDPAPGETLPFCEEDRTQAERLPTPTPSQRLAPESDPRVGNSTGALRDEVMEESPRPYQMELLEAAKRGNIVAYLETGAGKTLIAALLIKHVLETADVSKAVVFIADRVPLVIQQCRYIQRVIKKAGRVGVYYGDLGIDTWGEERWSEELANKRVMCMTAQVFLNALRHGVIDFETVALLVFDEAHHATKSHPFNTIMHEFYFPGLKAGLSPPPRVFGMTASPIKVKGATQEFCFCQNSIDSLQRNLQARVVVVSSVAQRDVDAWAANPDEFIVRYSSDDITFPDAVEPETLGPALDAVEFEVGECATTYLRNCFERSQTDSPGASSIPTNVARNITDKTRKLLELLIDECKRWRALPTTDTAFRCIVFVQRRAVAVALAWVINNAFADLDDVCLRARAVLGVHNTWSATPAAFRMTHPQQAEVLAEFRNGEFGVMVATSVVEEGLDVPSCGLVVMYNTVSTPKAYIQSRGRARHAMSRYVMLIPGSGLAAVFASQCIQQAKDGTEIMVRAVREGGNLNLDDHINLGAPVDLLGSESALPDESFLSSRTTRARVSASAALNLVYAYCSSLPRDKYMIADGAWQPHFKVEPDGTGCFLCTVELPTICPVRKGHCKVPQSSHIKAKRLAALDAYKSLYEIGAVDEHLFPRDYSSRYREVEVDPAQSEALKALGVSPSSSRDARAVNKASKRLRSCKVKQPSVLLWDTRTFSQSDEKSNPAFLYEILPDQSFPEDSFMDSVAGPCRYGIITKHAVEKDDLVALQPPTGCSLFTLALLRRIAISEEQEGILRRYSQSLYNVLLDIGFSAQRKVQEGGRSAEEGLDVDGENTGENITDDAAKTLSSEPLELDGEIEGSLGTREAPFRPGFFLAPLFESSSVEAAIPKTAPDLLDWQAMSDLIAFCETTWSDTSYGPSAAEDPHALQFRLVRSRHDIRTRLYFTGPLNLSLTASSPCAEAFGHSRFRTFLEYYQYRHGMHICDVNQPLLEGYSRQRIGRRLGGRKVFYLVPELCRSVPLSPWAAYYAALLPFWQSFLAVQAFRRKLDVHNTITFSDFAPALQPRRSSAHTAGVNYERLEFIGDAALKALASIATFQNRPFDHEGLLSSARDKAICNSFLCDLSQVLRAYDVVAMTGNSVKLKSWPWFLATPQECVLVMSEKLLADCLEALIGVHLVCGGFRFAEKFVADVGILQEVFPSVGRTSSLCQQHMCDGAEDIRLSSPHLGEVERILGYEFKRRELLLEALTHASYTKSKVMSYQRLEFLGDAVVGFLILDGFYRKYTQFAPAELTFLREPALSNELFGRVVIEHGLQRYLWYSSKSLKRDIDEVTSLLSTERDGVDAVAKVAMPKVLGDLLESLIGAIVVDQGMDVAGLDVIVDRLLGGALQRFANPETLARHPVTKIAHTLQAKFNETAVFRFACVDNASESAENLLPGRREAFALGQFRAGEVSRRPAIRCTVLANGVELASAIGPNRRKAKCGAAIAALEVVNGLDDATLKRMCRVNGLPRPLSPTDEPIASWQDAKDPRPNPMRGPTAVITGPTFDEAME